MMLFDERSSHVMKAHIRNGEAFIFVWPKNATLRDLQGIHELINLQLSYFEAASDEAAAAMKAEAAE